MIVLVLNAEDNSYLSIQSLVSQIKILLTQDLIPGAYTIQN